MPWKGREKEQGVRVMLGTNRRGAEMKLGSGSHETGHRKWSNEEVVGGGRGGESNKKDQAEMSRHCEQQNERKTRERNGLFVKTDVGVPTVLQFTDFFL